MSSPNGIVLRKRNDGKWSKLVIGLNLIYFVLGLTITVLLVEIETKKPNFVRIIMVGDRLKIMTERTRDGLTFGVMIAKDHQRTNINVAT